jgi:hypothetical protein
MLPHWANGLILFSRGMFGDKRAPETGRSSLAESLFDSIEEFTWPSSPGIHETGVPGPSGGNPYHN